MSDKKYYVLFAIYLRWCIEHDLMGEDFLAKYSQIVQKVRTAPDTMDLREFIRVELNGKLTISMFNKIGQAFTGYYYGEHDSPNFPQDIENWLFVHSCG